MSITSAIARMCKQDAVYWGNPQNDGYSDFTYDAAVEIKCRWEDKEQIVSKGDEKAVIFRSIIFLLQDVDTDGLLWLGSVDDLTSDQKLNPKELSGIMVIKRFEKSPEIKSTDKFLRKAFLSPYMY